MPIFRHLEKEMVTLMDTLERWWNAGCAFASDMFEDYDWRKIVEALVLLGGLGYLLINALQFSWPMFWGCLIITMVIIAWFNEWGSEAWRTWAMRVSTTVVAALAICAGIGASRVIDLTPYVDVTNITNPSKQSVAKAEEKKEEKKPEPKKGSPEWLEMKFGRIEERLDEQGRQIDCLSGKEKPQAKAKKDADNPDTLFNFDEPENVARPAPKNSAKPNPKQEPFKRSLAPPPPPEGELKLDFDPPGLPPLPGDGEPPIQKIDRSLPDAPKKDAPKSAPKNGSPGNREPVAIPRIAESAKKDAPQNASPEKRALIGYECTMGQIHEKKSLYQDPQTGDLLPYREDLHRHPDGTLCRCKKWLWKPATK